MTNFEDKPAVELPPGSSGKTMESKPDFETLKFSETQEDSNRKEELLTKDGDEKKQVTTDQQLRCHFSWTLVIYMTATLFLEKQHVFNQSDCVSRVVAAPYFLER